MGGKPKKSTPADKRLKANKPSAPAAPKPGVKGVNPFMKKSK